MSTAQPRFTSILFDHSIATYLDVVEYIKVHPVLRLHFLFVMFADCHILPSFQLLSYLRNYENTLPLIAMCNHIMTEPINHELRRLRRSSSLTQDDVARILGVGGRSYVSLLESGDRIPHVRDTVLLSMLFGTESKTIFPHLYVITKGQFVSNLVSALELALSEKEPDKERIAYMRDVLTEAQLSASTQSV